ncbi:MAG TPA: PVC-type heme-binding CxxCH protein, partial [Fimbriiglobus sp.]|nr:PVC-type heme-binding CxxCH protein [Fimbriiglobus sp.]
MTRRLFVLAIGLALSAPAFAQLPPDKALASLKAGDGLQVELFAAEPMLINPTSMDIDHLGRVWVCEAVNYRRKLFNHPMLRKEGDRIVVLTDKDGDGKADESTVFYQGEDLMAPLGVAVAKDATGPGYKVFVCQSPDILLFEDKDGDAKADGPPKKFLTGFQGIDHDHGVHSILIGPDGKLYFTVGDQGVKDLQSTDGKGRKWTTNYSDCQAGTVWRCDFDGKNLELIAHNFRNNYECCVNSFGEVWLSDNDDDGNQQTRICFVMPGGNYGYWPRGPGQTHWHEEQPGIVHKTLRTGFGSPTGICFYEGTLLPEKYRGQLLHTDAGPRELRCFHIKPKGAGYELTKEDLLTSTDNWFRPSDVCVAPDGSVFVCDWYDPGVGGHGMGDWTRGRVYRVTPKGHKGYKVPAVKLDTKEGVLAALGSPCLATRATAIAKLQVMSTQDYTAVLLDAMTPQDPILVARGYQQLREPKEPTPAEFGPVNKVGQAFRRAARAAHRPDLFEAFVIRMMSRSDFSTGGSPDAFKTEQFERDLDHVPASAWRELALWSGHMNVESAKPRLMSLAKKYDGKDHFYRAALNIACGTDPKRRDAILADFDKHFPEWNDTVADLVWELRPKSVLPRLTQLLADPKLTAAQKGRIVDILAVNDDP